MQAGYRHPYRPSQPRGKPWWRALKTAERRAWVLEQSGTHARSLRQLAADAGISVSRIAVIRNEALRHKDFEVSTRLLTLLRHVGADTYRNVTAEQLALLRRTRGYGKGCEHELHRLMTSAGKTWPVAPGGWPWCIGPTEKAGAR